MYRPPYDQLILLGIRYANVTKILILSTSVNRSWNQR